VQNQVTVKLLVGDKIKIQELADEHVMLTLSDVVRALIHYALTEVQDSRDIIDILENA